MKCWLEVLKNVDITLTASRKRETMNCIQAFDLVGDLLFSQEGASQTLQYVKFLAILEFVFDRVTGIS